MYQQDSYFAPKISLANLTVAIAPGSVLTNGALTNFPNVTTVAVASNATNYLYISLSGAVAISVNQTGFPASAFPLATAVTDAFKVTSLTDNRPDVAAGAGTITSSMQFTIDGGGATPATGVYGQISVPVSCTVTGWVLTADQSGSAVIDVLRSTYANFPTTASIAGSDKPTLSSVQKNRNLAVSAWGSTAIVAGDEVQINLNSVTTCTRLNLTLNITIP